MNRILTVFAVGCVAMVVMVLAQPGSSYGPGALGTTVVRALTEPPTVRTIDVELTKRVVRPPMSESEATAWIDRRLNEIKNGIASAPPPENMTDEELRALVEKGERRNIELLADRVVRERWQIGAEGSYRKDEATRLPEEDASADPVLRLTYVVGPVANYHVDYRRPFLTISAPSRQQWRFEDWRTFGSPSGMVGDEGRQLLRRLLGGEDSARIGEEQPEGLEVAQVREYFRSNLMKLGSVEANVRDDRGRVVDRIKFVSPLTGAPLLEFELDSDDPRICYEVKMFDGNQLVRKVRCERFAAVQGTGLSYPREAEIVDYRNGEEIRRESITVLHVSLNPEISASTFERPVIPEGWPDWAVADLRP